MQNDNAINVVVKMFHYLKQTYRSLTKRNIAKKQSFEDFNKIILTEIDLKNQSSSKVKKILNKCFLIVSVIQMVHKNCTGLYTVRYKFILCLRLLNI